MSQPFSESVKVVELLQRPFAQLPMSSDLPRLTNIRVVDDKGRSSYEQPSGTAPTLAKLRYTFVALTALLLDEKAVEMTKNTFDNHFAEGLDVSKLSMEGFLEKIGGDQSPVVQVLKAVNQSAISPAIIHLKLKLGLVNMTKDVRDSWFYEVIVSASTGQVVVASHKRDQSIKNEFQYEWVMAVHFDKTVNTEDVSESSKKSEDLPSSRLHDSNASGNDSPTSSSSVGPISITSVKQAGSPAASPRSSGSPKPSSSPISSISIPTKLTRAEKRRRRRKLGKEGSTSSLKSSEDLLESSTSTSLEDHISMSSDDDIDDDSATQEATSTQTHKPKVVISAGNTLSGSPTPSRKDAQNSETSSNKERSGSVDASSTDANGTPDGPSTPKDTASTTEEAAPVQEERQLSEEELYFKQKRFEFAYKCTNASLNVTDLMFSLALHTTNQAKRSEILKILEPYSSSDVIELSHTRNWEFFPVSASVAASAISLPGVEGLSASGTASGPQTPTSVQTSGGTPRLVQEVSDTATSLAASGGSPVVAPLAVQQLLQLSSSSGSPRASQTPPPVVQGVKEYDNGDRYEGGLCLGIREGQGKYICKASGVVYEGGYKDGKRHGKGHYAFATGAKVNGTFQRGVLVHGEYTFPNGDVYLGDFKDDKFDGQGEWKGAAGDRYTGAWKGGMRHGLGEAHLKLGDFYNGEFLNDAIHGFGKYRFANGDYFNGQFAAGMIHGVGEYTFAASGKLLLGEFAQGKLIKSSSITNPSANSANSANSTNVTNATDPINSTTSPTSTSTLTSSQESKLQEAKTDANPTPRTETTVDTDAVASTEPISS